MVVKKRGGRRENGATWQERGIPVPAVNYADAGLSASTDGTFPSNFPLCWLARRKPWYTNPSRKYMERFRSIPPKVRHIYDERPTDSSIKLVQREITCVCVYTLVFETSVSLHRSSNIRGATSSHVCLREGR